MMPKPCVIHIKIMKMLQNLVDNSYKSYTNVAKPYDYPYKNH